MLCMYASLLLLSGSSGVSCLLHQQLRQQFATALTTVAIAALQASVSKQLDALCEFSPICAPKRLIRRQQAEIQQLQQEISSLRGQLTERDARIIQLQQQVMAAQPGQQQ